MTVIPWVSFLLLVFLLLALDLGVLNRKVHVIHTKEALKWTCFWIALALLFTVGIYFMYEMHWCGIGLHEGANENGTEAAIDYLTGYIIEKALSLDNIAVMAMIFASFGIPLKYQHRVLFWGIIGALVFRGIMIGVGAAAVSQFGWVLYIFGALLNYIAIHSTFFGDDDTDPKDKWITKFLMKHTRYTGKVEGMHFFKRIDGLLYLTPLMVALIVIEVSDIVFAVDSIPAIFGITTDPFIVFTSNIFAILGLRSLYFVLASIIERFSLLKYAICFILIFVGVKLLMPAGYELVNWALGTKYEVFHLPNWTSLAVVAGAVIVGIVASIRYERKHPHEAAPKPADEDDAEAKSAKAAEAVEAVGLAEAIELAEAVEEAEAVESVELAEAVVEAKKEADSQTLVVE